MVIMVEAPASGHRFEVKSESELPAIPHRQTAINMASKPPVRLAGLASSSQPQPLALEAFPRPFTVATGNQPRLITHRSIHPSLPQFYPSAPPIR